MLELRPMATEDAEALREIRAQPAVSRWWDPPEDDFPLGDDDESVRLTIVHEGRVAGMIQFWEEPDPKYRHASVDLFLDSRLHGQGLGTEAVRHVVRLLTRERGHHRVVIDPAADNHAAIRAYAKAGFKPVGIMRAYERDSEGDGWHDGLLMELVVR